jgi:hypothetical protein
MAKSTHAIKKSVATKQGARSTPPAIGKGRSANRSSRVDTKPTGKIDKIVALLRRPKGASLDDLVQATGWQAHSVRGAISGTLRAKRKLDVASQKSDGVRLYRIADMSAG